MKKSAVEWLREEVRVCVDLDRECERDLLLLCSSMGREMWIFRSCEGTREWDVVRD